MPKTMKKTMIENARRKSARLLLPVLATVLLAACGTTSSLQRADDATARPDLSGYSAAVIADFSDAASSGKKFKDTESGAQKRAEYEADVTAAGVTFAEFLRAEIVKLGIFDEVYRGEEASPGALLIGGKITRFERGNAAAKFLIGLGAGSTYFDATVEVSDPENGGKLGEILVDKNSWVLGGAISASQNVEGFMRGGAEKAARELYIARFGAEPEG